MAKILQPNTLDADSFVSLKLRNIGLFFVCFQRGSDKNFRDEGSFQRWVATGSTGIYLHLRGRIEAVPCRSCDTLATDSGDVSNHASQKRLHHRY